MDRRSLVCAALFAAWVAHDLEEVATMPASSRELLRNLPKALPIPEDLRREGFSQHHVNVAVTMTGVLMAGAAADGARTHARSPVFQAVLAGFGWHGLGHLASSALTRRYTTGVLTSPVIVLPYWLWARRELTRAGVELSRTDPRLLAAMYPLFLGVHLLTHRLLAARDRGTP